MYGKRIEASKAHAQVFRLQLIDELCTECSLLIENHAKIQVLSSVHYNLGKTLQVSCCKEIRCHNYVVLVCVWHERCIQFAGC